MPFYIREPELIKEVEASTRLQEPITWDEACGQLRVGERLAAVINGPRGKLVTIVENGNYFTALTREHALIFIISSKLAGRAS